MNKFTLLFFAILLVCLPTVMKADGNEKEDETRYLAGAVPEVDGKVIFSKEYQIPGLTKDQIYERVLNWMTKRLAENKNAESRVVYTDEASGTIAGIGEQWLVFKSSALSLDRTLLNFQITATCKQGGCTIEIEKIRYTYREKEKYKAEEWITDKYALNKDKTKLVRGLAKWRKKTVDFADETFNDVAEALGAPVAKLKKETTEVKKTVATTTGPVIIKTGSEENASENKETSTTTSTPAIKGGKASADMPGYIEVDLKQIPGEIYAMMGNSKLVINIGKDEFNRITMTANAGGALGFLSGKAVAYCTLSADQSTEAMDKADTYTLNLYAPNQTTPSAVIQCKKLPAQAPAQAGQPKTYVGEILKLLIKQ